MKITPRRKPRFRRPTAIRLRTVLLAVLAAILPGAAFGQPATLVRDINPGSGPKPTSASFNVPVRSGPYVYFDTDAGGDGVQLWRTDGTAAGTLMVANFQGGAGGPFTDVGGTLFFVGPGGLWKTDGSPSGTMLVDGSTAAPSQVLGAHAFAGRLFYFKYVGNSTMELWKSDGTPGGTLLVQGGFVYQFSGWLPEFADTNGILFFTAADGSTGVELWKTDGSNTTLVKDINPGTSGSIPGGLTPLGNTLYFGVLYDPVAGSELWKTDGTPGGTILVKDIVPGAGSSFPGLLGVYGGRLVFSANDGSTGSELWATDGTEPGTLLLRDIRPGPASSYPSGAFSGPGGVYFGANDGTTGFEPWRTDGTPAGTIRLGDLYLGPLPSYPESFATLGANVLFGARDSENAFELWKTDGTPAGTARLHDVAVRSPFAELNGILIFFGSGSSPYSIDLWKTDGTAGGTASFYTFDAPAGSSPTNLTASGANLVFTATTPTDGTQVFFSNGSSAGTTQLTAIEHPYSNPLYAFKTAAGKTFFTSDGNLWVAPGGSQPVEPLGTAGAILGSLDSFLLYLNAGGLWRSDGTAAGTQQVRAFPYSPGPVVQVGAIGYFFTYSTPYIPELWRTDGTPGGTTLVTTLSDSAQVGDMVSFAGLLYFEITEFGSAAIWRSDGTPAGTHSEIPLGAHDLTVAGSTLFFSAYHPAYGEELWKSDGTLNGTFLVKDIFAGTGWSAPGNLVARGNDVFFVARDDSHGSELWKSDGSDVGTVRLTDIRPGPEGSNIRGLTVSSGLVYFTASDFTTGSELWKSDGTLGGTTIVRDIYAGPRSANPDALVDADGVIYFTATSPATGRELWKTDGTPGGTVLVRDIDQSRNDSTPSRAVEIGGLLYFTARTETNGVELWRSDGTSAGTTMVADVIAGPYSGDPVSGALFGGRLYFTAQDEVLGYELWSTDGTPSGTALVKDIRPGSDSSFPGALTVFGGRLYFLADDGVHGFELWVSDGTATGTQLLADLNPGPAPSYPVGFLAVGSYLYFTTQQPYGLWRTNGTVGGTTQLVPGATSNPVTLAGKVYVVKSFGTSSSELWQTDGTAVGTQLVTALPVNASQLVRSAGFVYFLGATNYPGQIELWRTDGTAVGTTLLRGGFVSYPTWLVDVAGTIFFVADDGVHGAELWKSTGTPAGTVLVADVWPGPLSSQPSALLNVGGTLVFRANDSVHGSELWVSDGTGPGTHLLQDIEPGVASSRPGFTLSWTSDWSAIAGTRVFFPATSSTSGNELWSMPMSAVCTPPAAPVVASSKNPSCGDAVILDAGPGYASYLWSTGEPTRTIQVMPSVTTSYTVYVGNALGCRSSQTFVQTVDPAMVPPAPSVSNSGPACVGDTIQLTASTVAGASYRWTGPNGFTSTAQNPTVPSATLAAAGLYAVEVTVNGCTSAPATTTVAVHTRPFRPVAHNDGPHCAGQTLQLSASYVPNAVYSWTGPNGFTSSLQSPVILTATPAASGVYSVTVAVDGCVSIAASTSVVVAACQALPASLSADAGGNGILEPGEMITLAPSWMNATGSPLSVTGTATSFTGPAGAAYSLSDATADYGSVAPGATSSCVSTGDCYAVGVSAPATRPVLHWDAAFSESLSTGDSKTWSLHVGDSFTDVPAAAGFYRFVETLLHNGVTTGCGGGAYCPASSVTRAQMAVFLLVSEAGAGYAPPAASGVFADVPVASPFAPWIEELARRGVTAGCGNGNFCPQADVTRGQMAVFLLVTREGFAYVPPSAVGLFGDVPHTNPFAPWIEELFRWGITAGCGNGNYCPSSPVSRAQMAVFVTTTFGLSLGTP